jgi:hypothetical protein
MRGLVRGTDVLFARAKDVDGRDKPDHDEFSCEITDAQNADDKITHRKSVEQAQSYTFKAVITIIVTGVVGAVWLGIKVMLGK